MTEEPKTFTLELGPLDSGMVEAIRGWRNDYAIWQFTRQNDLISDVEQADWFKVQDADPTVKMYRIQLSDCGDKASMVGVCGFTSIDYRNSKAEFSLYIAPGCQRKGLGRKALSLLLAHGFENHGFNLIYGEAVDGNPASRIFESLGLKWEGTRRDFYFKGGRRLDAHLYSILREEWLTHGRSADSLPSHRDLFGSRELLRAGVAGHHEGGETLRVDGAGEGDDSSLESAKAQAQSPKRRRRLGPGAERTAGASLK